MNSISTFLKHFLVAAGVTCAFSLFAYAAAAPDGGPDHCNGPMMPQPPHMHDDMREGIPPRGPGPDAMDMPGMDKAPPFLREITLSETQQDKIFSIVHASEPALREQSKLAKKNADAIRELADSNSYDESKLKSLSDAYAHAMAELQANHARSTHQILALLTPEQRKQVDAIKAKFDERHVLRTQVRDINNKFDNGIGSDNK